MGSISAEQNELFFHSCDDVLGFAGGRFSSIAILHQIDPDEHAEASHVSDDAVFLFELHQLIEQTVTYSDGVVHQLLFLDDVKDGVADGATYMITSVRVEVFHSSGTETTNYLFRSDHCYNRMTLPMGFPVISII